MSNGPKYAARSDANQAAIVEALRKAGASVRSIHRLGQGIPDLLVGYRGANYLLEVKSEGGELTPDELQFHETWRGCAAIVYDEREALRAIGAAEYVT